MTVTARDDSRFSKVAPTIGVAGTGLITVVGVFADLFWVWLRVVLLVVGLSLLVTAWIGRRSAERCRQREIEARREQQASARALASRLRAVADIDVSQPEHALDFLAPVIFRARVLWRLTVYVLEPHEDGRRWMLRNVLRRCSTEIYESVGRERIELDNSLFRDLANVDPPFSSQPFEVPVARSAASDEWQRWQVQTINDEEVVAELRMPSCNYTWCAAREPDGARRTIALMAETVEPDGIVPHSLDSAFIAPVLFMIARLIELPGEVGSATSPAAELLDEVQELLEQIQH